MRDEERSWLIPTLPTTIIVERRPRLLFPFAVAFLVPVDVGGSVAGQIVDHINRNRLDNRKSNLRLCDNALNQQNSTARKGSSRFKGVSFHKKRQKFLVQFRFQNKFYFVGWFDDEEDAARAYDDRLCEVAGSLAEFCVFNFSN